VNVVVAAMEATCSVPEVALAPDHPADAVHDVAFVLLHVSVLDWPAEIPAGLALSVTVGAGVD
jgi:hypothetical protein